MLFTNPRVLPALLMCIGFGLAGVRYMELGKLPTYTDEQIELSVELNYALDLARVEAQGEDMPGAQQRLDEKAELRQEIRQHLNAERDTMNSQIRQGLVAGLVGLGLYLGVLILQRREVIR